MNPFFVSPDRGAVHGGSKAKSDATVIFMNCGLKALRLGGVSLAEKCSNILAMLRVAAIGQPAIIFFHFPCYGQMSKLSLSLLSCRHRIVFLLHDVDQARSVSPTQSLQTLKRGAASIITGRLDDLDDVRSAFESPKHFRVRLKCWDYLVTEPSPVCAWQRSGAVLFGGSLAKNKSPWLYNVKRKMPLILAGTELDTHSVLPFDRYVGAFPADRPRFPAELGWGLVWDGDSPNELSGATGFYQRYNQPHKFSMYLAAGLPVICHKDAAVAETVREWNVGFCVSRIDEIADILDNLSDGAALEMHENVVKYRSRIVNGDFLRDAIGSVLAALGCPP